VNYNPFFHYLMELKDYVNKKRYGNTLGFTVNDLKSRWDNFFNNLNNTSLLIKNVKFTEAQFFQMEINNNIVLMGKTDSDIEGLVNEITLIGTGNGTIESGANIILSIGALVFVVNPYKDVIFRKKIIDNLGILNNEIINLNNTVIVDDLKYSLKYSQQLGLWLTVSRLMLRN
jgi:hypothetical protein